MTSKTTYRADRLQPLQVEWRDQSGPLTVVFFKHKAAPVRICGAGGGRALGMAPRGLRSGRGSHSLSTRGGRSRAFTLLELLIVLAIIGLMAGLTLPHLRGFTKSNAMQAATRQLLDDIAYARKRAMVNRATVYMVFVPPSPWSLMSAQNFKALPGRALTNIVTGQYRGYALVSLRSVGDQPGQTHPSFLTDWKTLPNGVIIAPYLYSNGYPALTIVTTNMLSQTTNGAVVLPFATNTTVYFPFPSLQTTSRNLPYIGFSPNGQLVDEFGATAPDQYIALAASGVLYPSDNNGNPLLQAPFITESTAGEWTNNATLVHIDATTARAKLERNQLQ